MTLGNASGCGTQPVTQDNWQPDVSMSHLYKAGSGPEVTRHVSI